MTQSFQTMPQSIKSLMQLHSLENPPPMQKTLGFYGVVTDNAWNRPATASKKVFEFYHKDNIAKENLIKSMKEMQVIDGQEKEKKKKIRVLTAKHQDKLRLEARTLETNRFYNGVSNAKTLI